MRAGCRKPGCLTHPALCEGRKCPDWRNSYIPRALTHSHGTERKDGEYEVDVLRGGASKAEEDEGRSDLGRVSFETRGNSGRIKNSCLPRVRTSRKAGLVA